MIEEIRLKFLTYINSLTIYDYVAFGWLIFFILIILVLIVLLSRKKPKLAIFMLLFTLLLIVVAPIGIKYFLDMSVRKVELFDKKVTKLNYDSSLILTAKLKNSGKITYKKCFISAKVFKIENNKYKDILNRLKPMRIKTISIDKRLHEGDVTDFKIIIDGFKYGGDFNTSLSAECY